MAMENSRIAYQYKTNLIVWTSMREFWTAGVFFLSPLPHQLPPIPSMTCCHDALDFWWKLKQTQKSDSYFSSVGLFFLLWSFFPFCWWLLSGASAVPAGLDGQPLVHSQCEAHQSAAQGIVVKMFFFCQHHRSHLDGFDRLQRPVRRRERWWWWSWKRQDQHSKFNH